MSKLLINKAIDTKNEFQIKMSYLLLLLRVDEIIRAANVLEVPKKGEHFPDRREAHLTGWQPRPGISKLQRKRILQQLVPVFHHHNSSPKMGIAPRRNATHTPIVVSTIQHSFYYCSKI